MQPHRKAPTVSPLARLDRLARLPLRFGRSKDEAALHAAIVTEAARLLGAQRVLLTLQAGTRLAGCKLPAAERAEGLLRAVGPWLTEALHTGESRLRHGPAGAAPVEQRSCLVAPLLAPQGALGCLYVDLEGAQGRFDEADRALLTTLAAMAAAAQNSLRSASASLEYQVAISQVLRVISESPTDVAPVFEAIMDSGMRLFQAQLMAIFRYDGRLIHFAAHRNWPSEALAQAQKLYPVPADERTLAGRAILSGKAIAVADTQAERHYTPALLAKKTNAPVMMRVSREEESYFGRARTNMVGRARAGFAKDGRILALDLFIVQDNGPYGPMGDHRSAGNAASLIYQPAAMRWRAVNVLTNTPPRSRLSTMDLGTGVLRHRSVCPLARVTSGASQLQGSQGALVIRLLRS